jgi:integrase
LTAQRRFGALRKLPSGRWQARYWSPDGTRITADRTFATKTDAARFLEQMEVDQLRGVWHDPTASRSTSVRDWAWRWFDQHSASLRTSTVDSYKGLLDTCVLDRTVNGKQIGLGDLVLQSLTPMRIGEWLAQLQRDGLSASRVRQAYRVLSLALDAAVRDRLLTSNPCGRHHRLPRLPETEPTILTVADVEKLVAHLRDGAGPRGMDRSGVQPIPPNPSLALLVELLAYGGLRIGEARALRRRHVDVLGCRLIVAESLTEVDGKFTFGPTKTHQVREVPLPRGLLPELTLHLDAHVATTTDALVFTGRTGEPLHYTSVRRSFDAACRRVDLVAVTPHSLRASCASWVAESDGVLEAARRLGHSRSSVTTRHYARPMKGGDDVVAERLDAARTGARETAVDPEGPSLWARSGHDGRITPVKEAGGGEAHPF